MVSTNLSRVQRALTDRCRDSKRALLKYVLLLLNGRYLFMYMFVSTCWCVRTPKVFGVLRSNCNGVVGKQPYKSFQALRLLESSGPSGVQVTARSGFGLSRRR